MRLEEEYILLKEEFNRYLINSGYAKERAAEHAGWAFFIKKYVGTREFIQCLREDAEYERAEGHIMRIAQGGGVNGKGVKNPKGYVAAYMVSFKLFKEFIDSRYGDIENCFKGK